MLPVTGNLALWLKANVDATPALWEDQSGNGNDAVQNNTGNQAVFNNTLPILNFNETFDFNRIASLQQGFDIDNLQLGNNASVFIVSDNDQQIANTSSSLRPLLIGSENLQGGGSFNGYAFGKIATSLATFASGPDNDPCRRFK